MRETNFELAVGMWIVNSIQRSGVLQYLIMRTQNLLTLLTNRG